MLTTSTGLLDFSWFEVLRTVYDSWSAPSLAFVTIEVQ